MISHISIKNFAIIENTEVDFEEGLNIITGETGSGKSIVIEAVSLALGSRADTSCIRTGSDKAIVQLAGNIGDEDFVITRQVSSTGKNLCKLNGEIVTLTQLNQICGKLADIHGQYDNQSLLNPDYHITLLDAYRFKTINEAKAKVRETYEAFAKCKGNLLKLLSMEKESAKKKDFYQFEIDEIDKARLVPKEDKELEERVLVLQNSEKIYENIEKAYGTMYGAAPSAVDGISSSLHALEEISPFSKDIAHICEELGDLYYGLEDLCGNLRNIKETITFSPSELDAAISRLDLINSLKKKYGSSIEEILSYRDKIAKNLNLIGNFDKNRLALEKELKTLKVELIKECSDLTDLRKKAAAELEAAIHKELLDLNFMDSNIAISIEPLESPTENGMDKVEILISTNKGEPLKPLYKVASGGEMSRIMLAFKNIISSYDMIPTLIFDEIDNGISGITASIVGKKLKQISDGRQIICITHLPQIAACGKHNYRIVKNSDGESTFTVIEPLNETEKIKEIARLLGGSTITETTLSSARELIEHS